MFEFDGMQINYMVKGSGRDVVILHGWGASIGAVTPIVRLLADAFRVTAIDLPGCGGSSDPLTPLTVEDYARLVLAICSKEGIENPILIAHSNGGRIAVHLNTKSSLKIHKNIFIDIAGIPAKKSLKTRFKTFIYKLAKKLVLLWGSRTDELLASLQNKYGSEDYKNATPVMKKTMVNMLATDLTGEFPKIKVPTLLIWGENDTATPLVTARKMEKLIPDSGLVVIKGTGHFSYLENPMQFNAVVSSFLSKDRS